ncbi:unnamed protein product [Microthlaspi erraticum]|uniref:Reverse transcriptase zinc-binding domain-containing protein n=1 Tax=Microthlaspi erraticum TaxID=1685480 RepID=A0A6D2I941_9BRAS|nr:unnamed protein product [Microthlaspi erraticum]
MSNSAWAEEYPSGRSEYLRFEGSDHRPIITIFDPTRKKKRGLFRYDLRLKENEEVQKLIFEAWNTSETDTVEGKISRCRREIICWNKEKHLNSQERIERYREDLEEAMMDIQHNTEIIEELNRELGKAYREEEAFWKQRSRQLWLALGEQNTSYFHAVTKGRKATNKFSVIEDEGNNSVYEENEIIKVITDFYQKLFTTEEGERKSTVFQALKPCISEEVNKNLIKIPTPEEIKQACFSIHPEKAPGPDGFSACFFQTNWEKVKTKIISEIQQFFSTGILPRNINATHVRLIPKIASPKKVSDYRPIALCNVYFKMISKILTLSTDSAKDLLKPLVEKAIGDGNNTRLWKDPWLSMEEQKRPIGPPTETTKDMLVGELLHMNTKAWDKEKIRAILPNLESEILQIQPSRLGAKDKIQPSRLGAKDNYIWLPSESGVYTAKSGYYESLNQSTETSEDQDQQQHNFKWMKHIWNIHSASKTKMFLWKAMNGALPVGENLKARNINLEIRCPHCGEEETTSHLLFHCTYAAQIWRMIPCKDQIDPLRITDIRAGIELSPHVVCLPPTETPIGRGNPTPSDRLCKGMAEGAAPEAQTSRSGNKSIPHAPTGLATELDNMQNGRRLEKGIAIGGTRMDHLQPYRWQSRGDSRTRNGITPQHQIPNHGRGIGGSRSTHTSTGPRHQATHSRLRFVAADQGNKQKDFHQGTPWDSPRHPRFIFCV